MGKAYRKEFSPLIYNTPTVVNISLYLLAVNQINELEMRFTPKFRVHLRWHDFRLKYMNLNEGKYNTVERSHQSDIWIPTLFFPENDDNVVIRNDDHSMLEILALGKGHRNDINDLHEAMLYEGTENLLIFTREMDVSLRCSYDLRNYPFDSQTCPIKLEVPFALRDYVKLVPGKAQNIWKKSLAQFDIINVAFATNDSTPYIIECNIKLQRIPLNHLATTYAPTLCILSMAIITLFIDESHFEATIMVSLTAMLVMYTLFQSISTNMPSTAYLKLLDFWLIFGLVMPFIIFVVEVSWELGVGESRGVHCSEGKSMKRKRNLGFKQLTKYGIPAFTLGFILAYIFVVLSIHD